MNEMLVILQTRGLVERGPHRGHGRVLQAHLSEAGKALLDTFHARVRTIEVQISGHSERHLLVRARERCAMALHR